MKRSVPLASAVLWLAMPVHAAQIVTPAQASVSASSGGVITFSPVYTVSTPQDGTVTGLGIRIHFNSSALQFNGVSKRFAYGLLPAGDVSTDTENYDADATTDKYFILPWVDVSGQWPGGNELPLTLASVSFTAKAGFTGSTMIRVSASGTVDGAVFQTTPMTVSVATGNASLKLKGFLQGAYNSTDGQMRDSLRSAGLLPLAQPYGYLGHQGAETTTATLLNTTGVDAPVDWVLVELRDKANASNRLAAKAALLQSDGDVVDAATGSSTLTFADTAPGSYYVALRHRNHLGVMTASPPSLTTTPVLVDFTASATALYGSDIRAQQGSTRLLPAGDASLDNKLIAAGPDNDKNAILAIVLADPANTGSHTNFQSAGYQFTDQNMDGKTLYSGPDNDVNGLLGNILLAPGNSTNSTNYILPGSLPQ